MPAAVLHSQPLPPESRRRVDRRRVKPRFSLLLPLLLLLLALLPHATLLSAPTTHRPNVVLILADDMRYSDSNGRCVSRSISQNAREKRPLVKSGALTPRWPDRG
jgi:hypothetical protein